MKQLLIFIIACLVLGSPPASARYRLDETGTTKVDKTEKKKKKAKRKAEKKKKQAVLKKAETRDESDVIQDLAGRFSLDPKKVRYLRDVRHGYREIVYGLLISQEAQVEVGRVLQKRVVGESWNSISSAFFVDFSDVKKQGAEILKPIKKVVPSKWITERPQLRK